MKMKNRKIVKKIFDITKKWELKKELLFIGKTFRDIKMENGSKQYVFFLSPVWLNEIIATCGKIPSKYSYETAVQRIGHTKHYPIKKINSRKNLFGILLKNKKLAAGAFIVSMDFECQGAQTGRISLCMSKKYKDFLEEMLEVAKKWKWTNNKQLSHVDVSNSIARGIAASPQYEFRINSKGLYEIYKIAGPLADPFKDKCIKFHIERSKKYKNLGYNLLKNNTKQKIFEELLQSSNYITTTELQFTAGVGNDVILTHLHNLEKEGKVSKERQGKKYVWKAIK